jgi:hypothetical protein
MESRDGAVGIATGYGLDVNHITTEEGPVMPFVRSESLKVK